MREQEIRKIIREEIRNQLNESMLIANHAQKAREAIEREVVPILERLNGVTKGSNRDKAGWTRSILEDQKDVYEELSDLESSMRGQETQFPGYNR